MDKHSNMFILGASRSGTTLLKQVLANHSKVLGLNELQYFSELIGPQNRKLKSNEIATLVSIILARHRRDYWAKVNEEDQHEASQIIENLNLHEGITTYCLYQKITNYLSNKNFREFALDQSGKYIYYYDLISKNLPHSLFLYIYRDPRSVINSQKNRWKQRFRGAKNVPFSESIRTRINYNPILFAVLWNKANKNYNDLIHRNDTFNIKFEDFIEKPSEVTAQLCKFISIEFEPEMLNIYQITSSHTKDNKLKGFRKESIGSFNLGLSKTEIWIIQLITKKLFNLMGYEFQKVRPNPFLVMYFMLLIPFQILAILIFNFTKYRRLIS